MIILLCVIDFTLAVVCCLLFVVCCLLFVVCCLLFVVCCLLFVVCCLFVVYYLLFIIDGSNTAYLLRFAQIAFSPPPFSFSSLPFFLSFFRLSVRLQ